MSHLPADRTGRTLVNLTLAYESKHHWSLQVNVDNLFDAEYILASVHRGAIFPGPPRNIRISYRLSF